MDMIRSVSVIIPAYNEEENINTLLDKTVEVLISIGIDYEIVVVDDGSQDNTLSVAKEFATENEKIVVIGHFKRRGKSMALRSGFARAKYEAIVIMDADLQYDPQEIPCLLSLLEKGYDVVNGYRDFSKYVLSRTIISRFYNELSRSFLGSKGVHDLNCGLKAFRKEVVEHLLREFVWRRGVHRFLISFCTASGYSVTEVRVSLKHRVFGHSKYGLGRVVEGFSMFFIMFVKIKIVNLRSQVLFIAE